MDPNYSFELALFRGRGHSKKLGRRFAKKNIRRNFFSQRALDYWYSLSSEEIEGKKAGEFKKKYDNMRTFS